MRILLDTQVFLWFIAGNQKLPLPDRNMIADFDNELYLSIASLWEIAIKVTIGKLELLEPFEELIPKELSKHEIKILPIEIKHLVKIIQLPIHHRDPFDRLIIAQGNVEDYPIISADSVFKAYPVNVIW